LILQGVNTIRVQAGLADPRRDIQDVVEAISDVFTELGKFILDLPAGIDPHEARAEAQFLFGGWSWREKEFCVWKISYVKALGAFVHELQPVGEDLRFYRFIGDHTDEADKLLEEDLKQRNKLMKGRLDMELLRVLVSMCRDDTKGANGQPKYREIGGAVQVAKIYQSGHHEFFGVWWPSDVKGAKQTLLGREISIYQTPHTRLIDPDTGEISMHLPTNWTEIEMFDFGFDKRFVETCFVEKEKVRTALRDDLQDHERERLGRILRESAYEAFLEKLAAQPVAVANPGAPA
jgi:hypothetical protein